MFLYYGDIYYNLMTISYDTVDKVDSVTMAVTST